MLQKQGMSGQQLKLLLVLEGLYYVIGTVIGTLILSIIISFGIMRPIINSLTWFQFDFTIAPLLVVYPILLMRCNHYSTCNIPYYGKRKHSEKITHRINSIEKFLYNNFYIYRRDFRTFLATFDRYYILIKQRKRK